MRRAAVSIATEVSTKRNDNYIYIRPITAAHTRCSVYFYRLIRYIKTSEKKDLFEGKR